MEYITLNNGVKMPMLGFGTFKAAGEDCSNSVTEAIRAGYRMIDTAEAYGNEKDVARASLPRVSTGRNFSWSRKSSSVLMITRVSRYSIPWKILRLITWTWCCCTGPSETITQHGGSWKSSMKRERSAPSAFPTSILTA